MQHLDNPVHGHLDRFVVAGVHLLGAPKSTTAFISSGCSVVYPLPPPHPPPPRGPWILNWCYSASPSQARHRRPRVAAACPFCRRAPVPGSSLTASLSPAPASAPASLGGPRRRIVIYTFACSADILQAEPASERGWQGEYAKS
ncbi:hypothetical protein DL765_002052 [Monosporascus sp. GIB2]|nr:hypothetical protein DL765_002052 [Monosporascus sp. GIB2]